MVLDKIHLKLLELREFIEQYLYRPIFLADIANINMRTIFTIISAMENERDIGFSEG